PGRCGAQRAQRHRHAGPERRRGRGRHVPGPQPRLHRGGPRDGRVHAWRGRPGCQVPPALEPGRDAAFRRGGHEPVMASTSESASAPERNFYGLARPLKLLIYLVIVLAIVELYRQASTLVLQLTNIGLIFMFAAVIAMLVTPVVDSIQRVPFFRSHRGAAVLLLYGAIVIVVGGAAFLLAPTVIVDAGQLGKQVPVLLDGAQHVLDRVQSSLRAFGINLSYTIPRGGASIGGDISPASLTTIGGLLSPLVNFLLVIVISIYLTGQGRQLVATARKLFPAQERIFDFTMLAVGAAVAAYVRAQLLMSLVIALYTGITLTLLGVHYAAALGVAVFILEMVPLIGAPVGFL